MAKEIIESEKDSKQAKPYRRDKNFKKRGKYEEPRSESFCPGNDPEWWKKVPELMKDASNLKSNWIAGTPIDEADIPYVVPGALVAKFRPSYGVSYTETHPLNVWSRDLYLRMFQKWRGISAYEHPDLGIAIVSQIECVRMIAKLERIYGVVVRYDKANMNMPYAEAEALGLTAAQAEWIRGHLSDYRYDLNELIRKAQRLCIPKDMTVLNDYISLCGYEYLDHENRKAQIVIFDCDHFGVFSDTLLQTGGSIEFKLITMTSTIKLIDTTGTLDNMFEGLSTMLDAILGSSGVNRILGDLLTWFGEGQLLQFKPLPDEYIVVPVYSESILHKLHNIECTANDFNTVINSNMDAADISALESANFVIYQYNNNIICRPSMFQVGPPAAWQTDGDWRFKASAAQLTNVIYDHNTFIDTYRVADNEDTVIEGSLFKAVVAQHTIVVGGTNNYTYEFKSTSFEVITSLRLYSMTTSGTVTNVSVQNMQQNPTSAASNAGYLAVIDWAPLSYSVTNGQIGYVFGDVDTPIPLPRNAECKIHRAIIYSGLQTDIKVLDTIHQ